MLQLSGAPEQLGQRKARELIAQKPRIVRHTRAWVDDSELCLEVECALNDGSSVLIEMYYCWSTCGGPAAWERTPYYFMNVVELLLNNRWLDFYRWVQEQFDRSLQDNASRDYFAEFDEPVGPAPDAEPHAAPDPAT